MNFFKDTTVATDNAIQHTYYSGLSSEADGIDLRIEMNRLLYGTTFKKPKGHWVIVRHFSKTDHSKYYNKYTKEGILGPARNYTDTLVRTKREPTRLSSNSLDDVKAGIITQHQYEYYLEHTVDIKDGDQIYELSVLDHASKPSSYTFTEKYDVSRVHPYRLENGNVQYYKLVCDYNNITY